MGAARRAGGRPAADWLERLIAGARADAARRQKTVSRAAVERRAAEAHPAGPAFVAALSGRPGRPNVIAECKRRSPSRGSLFPGLDPGRVAAAYERAGAVAVSILTEARGFGGSFEDLVAARAATRLPLLCKDFILTEYQLAEATAAGADAVLLLAAALPPPDLAALARNARALGLAALAEVHDERELALVLDLDAGIQTIGVNCRNLRTFEVDPSICERLAPLIPPGFVAVAESGIRTPGRMASLSALGYSAFLVGEALVAGGDPGGMLARWLAEARACG